MKTRLSGAIAAAFVATVLAVGSGHPALAHDPIFVTDDQTTPDTGPFMPDGSISWALYGTVLDDGDTRGFEFDLRDGDEVFVSLLIPNLTPEVDLNDDQLPVIELEAPDGTTTTIAPEVREVFDEPFSNTSYVTLAEYRQPAQAGRYRGVIVGGAPARFSVAIGETEEFFTPTERSGDRPSSFAEISAPLTAWYTTLPGGEPDPNQLTEGEAEIDLDLIEEAMDSGEASAPDGRLGNEDDDASDDDATEAVADGTDAVVTDDEEVAATAADEEAPEPETAASEAAGEPEVAAESAEPSDGSSTTWVAPAAIAAIALLGGGAFLMRRRQSAV